MIGPEKTRVGHAVAHPPIIIEGLATVTEALDLLMAQEHRALLINKRDPADEYGLLTVDMIAEQVIATNRNPDRVSVYEIMQKPTVSLPHDMQARYAIRLMCRLGLDYVVATQGDQMLGCVSVRDLSFAIVRQRRETTADNV